MENAVPPIRPDGAEPAKIVDVRDVPLRDLAQDAAVRHMVSRVTGSIEDPSRIRVAMFNSAI